MNPILIVISGPAASGKSTLASYLAKKLKLPAFGVDLYKEQLYDSFGPPKSLAEHRQYGGAGYRLLEKNSLALLLSGTSNIIEGSFQNVLFTPKLLSWLEMVKFNIIQIQLHCDGDVLLQRFIDRENGGKQHPGHQGLLYLYAMEDALLKGYLDKLELPGGFYEIDSTNLATLDAQCGEVIRAIRSFV